jgi:WD40 repeat protein
LLGGLRSALAGLQATIAGGVSPNVRVLGPPKSPPSDTASGLATVVEAARKIKAHDGKVLFVTCAPAGDRLLSTGEDGTVRLWLLDGSEVACLRPPKGWLKPAAVIYAAFTPDARRAFSVSADGLVRL